MKISIITFCIAVLLSTGIATAQNISVFGDGFSQGKLESYLENTKILKTGQASFEPSKDGKGKCLVLAKDTSAIFKPVPVKDNVKYKLSFTVRGEMKETIEENPRLELILLSRGNWLPFCNIAFLDAEMKPLAWCNYEHTLPFGSHFNFTELFHPPEKAAFLQLSIQTRKDSKIFLSDISLVPASDEGAINVNPTFSLGKYNFSGWPRRHTNGRILEKPDGKFVFDTGYGSGSETIPLSKPGTYRLYAKGSTYGGYSEIILKFLAQDGKEISTVKMNAKQEGAQKDFVLPSGTSRISFLVYNNILEEFRLTNTEGKGIDQKPK